MFSDKLKCQYSQLKRLRLTIQKLNLERCFFKDKLRLQASRLKSSKETSFNLTDSSNQNAEDAMFTLKNSVCMFADQAPTPNIDDILDSNLKLRQ
jgi:hypothetical protein